MLGIFRKKLFSRDILAAVYPSPAGVAVARVRRDRDVPPSLEVCDFKSAGEDGSASAELRELIKSHHLDQSPGVSVMEFHSYQILQVEAPEVEQDEMDAAIRWRIKDLIDFDISDAVVDVFDVPDAREAGQNGRVYAVVARTDLVRSKIDALLGAGLHLEIIEIPELALRNIASLLPEDVSGVALIYIGGDDGLITITRQGTLYFSHRIQIGYNALPDAAVYANDAEVIERWLDSIIIEIQRSLDYYGSQFSQPPVAGLIMTPADHEIPGITEYLNDQMGIPARMLDVNELIDVPETIDADLRQHCRRGGTG
ncbi:MAG: pilus assembly protein PilM [Pseudomonadales bacterium]|nr:pilus assembly protein PilM [Pseudomonadales bacterium]MDP7596076.1 pilus assembly protein PilM [Pseudomonadales bacterium]HJN52274.1 pilus assembly protein PilM [Pseudomonadales bacterium]